jgi:hypothetical protein
VSASLKEAKPRAVSTLPVVGGGIGKARIAREDKAQEPRCGIHG